jgi:hypothetical protein
MAITAQQAINRAIQRSALNNPDLVPIAQVLGYITNFERSIYATGARYNPDYFGKSAATAARSAPPAGGGGGIWNLTATPGDVFAVSGLSVLTIAGSISKVGVGTEINIVGMRWPELQVTPRVYIRGQKVYEYSDDLSDNATDYADTLTVFYSEMPAAVTSTSANLTLPDEWADLIIVPLARILAIRDHRPEEVQLLDQEYNSLMATFIDHVSVYDHSATRPLIAVPAATGPRPPAGGGVQPGAPRIFG